MVGVAFQIFSLETLAYLGVGMGAGFLSGLFGIGGGLIVIPSLFLVLPLFGYDSPETIRIAMATSLAASAISTSASAYHHLKKANTLPHIAKVMMIPTICGAVAGVMVAKSVTPTLLKGIFCVVLIGLGVRYVFQKRREEPAHSPTHHSKFLLGAAGALIGFLGAFLGLGGGLFVIPFLFYLGCPTRKSIGTSSLLTCAVTITGATCYLLAAKEGSSREMVGNIYLPAWLAIGAAAAVCTQFGAHWMHRVDAHLLRQCFGGVLILSGFLMLYG